MLFGGSPPLGTASTRAEAQQRQQQYAADLRAQMAAKEQQRQVDRAQNLRQSFDLLQLRQAAPSAVLPGPSAVSVGSGSSRFGVRNASPVSMPLLHPKEAGPGSDFSARHGGTLHGQPQQQQAAAGAPDAHQDALDPPSINERRATGQSSLVARHSSSLQQHDWVGSRPIHGTAPGWQVGAPQQPPQPAPLPARMQLPYSSDHHQYGGPLTSLAQLAPDWQAPASQAPFGNDLQQHEMPGRRRSVRRRPSGYGAPSLPPWVAYIAPSALASGTHTDMQPGTHAAGVREGGGGMLAAIGDASLSHGDAAREVEARKRAAYRADLERQLQLKQERQRQEKAAEQTQDACKAREAQAMLQRAASGVYGGGGGPLRAPDGRPITDLNKVRHHQMLDEQAEQSGAPRQDEPALDRAGSIPAHWGHGAEMDDWAGQAGSGRQSLAQHPPLPPGYPDMQYHPNSSSWPAQGHQPPPPPNNQPSNLPPTTQPSLQGGWSSQNMTQVPATDSNWHHGGQQRFPAPTSPHSQPFTVAWAPEASQASLLTSAGDSPPPAPTPASATASSRGFLSSLGAGGLGERTIGRMRSDRPNMTASEAEKRAAAQAEFKEALKQQMEEKARHREEELRRRKAEEAEEDARVVAEQERLRQQFTQDQSKQKAKQAAQEAKGAETMEAGGITIKFKPPPAGRQSGLQPVEKQTQHEQLALCKVPETDGRIGAGADLAVDGAAPGVETLLEGRLHALSAGRQGQQKSDAGPASTAAGPTEGRAHPVLAHATGVDGCGGGQSRGDEQQSGRVMPSGPYDGLQRLPSLPRPEWQQQQWMPPPNMPQAPPAWQEHPGMHGAPGGALMQPASGLPPLGPVQPSVRSVPPGWGPPSPPQYLLPPPEQNPWAGVPQPSCGGPPYSVMAGAQWMQPQQPAVGAGLPWPNHQAPRTTMPSGFYSSTPPTYPQQWGPPSQQSYTPGLSAGLRPAPPPSTCNPHLPHFETSGVLSLSDSPAERGA